MAEAFHPSGKVPRRRQDDHLPRDFDDRPTMPMELIAEPLHVPVGEAVELPEREGREAFLKAWERQQGSVRAPKAVTR